MWKKSYSAPSRVAAVVASATAAFLIAGAPIAIAGGDLPLRNRGANVPFNSGHDALIQIKANEPLPQRRIVTVGLHKSVMVELPRELRDVVVSNPEHMDAIVQASNRDGT